MTQWSIDTPQPHGKYRNLSRHSFRAWHFPDDICHFYVTFRHFLPVLWRPIQYYLVTGSVTFCDSITSLSVIPSCQTIIWSKGTGQIRQSVTSRHIQKSMMWRIDVFRHFWQNNRKWGIDGFPSLHLHLHMGDRVSEEIMHNCTIGCTVCLCSNVLSFGLV